MDLTQLDSFIQSRSCVVGYTQRRANIVHIEARRSASKDYSQIRAIAADTPARLCVPVCACVLFVGLWLF